MTVRENLMLAYQQSLDSNKTGLVAKVWRITAAAVLMELGLLVFAAIAMSVLANPFTSEQVLVSDHVLVSGQALASEQVLLQEDTVAYFASIAAACFLISAACCSWVLRPFNAIKPVLGALAGLTGTLIYLAICAASGFTVAEIFFAYGPFWFFVCNGMRILGAALGASIRTPKTT